MAKKKLQFVGLSCTSKAQIEWKQGSQHRVIFRDMAEMARRLKEFRKKHLSSTTSAKKVTDYNAMAKHLQSTIDHVKLVEEFGWEVVGKVVENPLAANPKLAKAVKSAWMDLEKDRVEEVKRRNANCLLGRSGGQGVTTGYYDQQQGLSGQQPAHSQNQPRPLLQQNVGYHPYLTG